MRPLVLNLLSCHRLKSVKTRSFDLEGVRGEVGSGECKVLTTATTHKFGGRYSAAVFGCCVTVLQK